MFFIVPVGGTLGGQEVNSRRCIFWECLVDTLAETPDGGLFFSFDGRNAISEKI